MKKGLILAFILMFTATAAFAAYDQTDNFNDNSIDTGKWDQGDSGSGSTSETNNQIEITLADPTTAWNYHEIYSHSSFDFSGKELLVEIVNDPQTDANGYLDIRCNNGTDDNGAMWHLSGGSVYAKKNVGGSSSTEWSGSSGTNTAWLRIREDSGTIYWDTSSNGTSWTNRASYSHSFTTTGSVAFIGFSEITGGVSSPGTFKVDNYNVPPEDDSQVIIISDTDAEKIYREARCKQYKPGANFPWAGCYKCCVEENEACPMSEIHTGHRRGCPIEGCEVPPGEVFTHWQPSWDMG